MSETWKDPIVEEVREARRQIMQECGNDPAEYLRRVMESQKRTAWRQHGHSIHLLRLWPRDRGAGAGC